MTAPHIVDPAGLLAEALSDASPDLMRNVLQTINNARLSAEAEAEAGAKRGKPSPAADATQWWPKSRAGHPGGHDRCSAPEVAAGAYFLECLLERRNRAEAALTTVVADRYVAWFSTRRMDKLVKTLGISGPSKSQESRIAADLDEFRHRPWAMRARSPSLPLTRSR